MIAKCAFLLSPESTIQSASWRASRDACSLAKSARLGALTRLASASIAGAAGALCDGVSGTDRPGGVASSSVAAWAEGSSSARAVPMQRAFMAIQILEVLQQRGAIV